MIQTTSPLVPEGTPAPEVPVPEIMEKSFWESMKGMGMEDFLSKILHVTIDFALHLALAIAVFYLGRFIIRKIYKVVFNIMTKRHVDASLSTFVLSFTKMSLYFILIVMIIGILGLETSSFLALFASAGVAIGMALSGTLQNFAGGVLILLLKPYKVGDFIDVQGYQGTVKSIQLFNTVINTIDNKAVIIPNGVLSTTSINNYSLEKVRRVDWTVSLAYGTDLEAAKKAILDILSSDPRVLQGETEEKLHERMAKEVRQEMRVALPMKQNLKPFVSLNEMADSSINLTVRAWSLSTDYWPLYFEINERLYTELPKLGFEFPFPQMDVHLDKV